LAGQDQKRETRNNWREGKRRQQLSEEHEPKPGKGWGSDRDDTKDRRKWKRFRERYTERKHTNPRTRQRKNPKQEGEREASQGMEGNAKTNKIEEKIKLSGRKNTGTMRLRYGKA